MEITIIGGGPGGYVAAIKTAQMGAKVVLVERHLLGGTCLNYGCIPTKAMISDLKIFRKVRERGVLHSNLLNIDFERMITRRDNVVSQLRAGLESLLKKNCITYIYGEGVIEGRGKVEVRETLEERRIVKSDVIIIALGGKPKEISGLEVDGTLILKPEQILDIKIVPKSILIVGGGIIGVELATIFSNLGSKVSLVEMLPRILPNEDVEISQILSNALKKEGVSVFTGYKVKDLKKKVYYMEAIIFNGREEQGIKIERIIVAAGRIPNIPKELVDLGIELEGNGIRVDTHMRTTAEGFYAIGDSVGRTMLANVAMQEGIAAAKNIIGQETQMDYRFIPNCIFTIPEVASVGLTEEVARKSHSIKVGRFPFYGNPRAVVENEAEGLIKIIADSSSDEILGVHIVGPQASDLISVALAYMKTEATLEDLANTIYGHPTLAEALREAAMDIKEEPIHILPKNIRSK
jgi:dihydrolipoamide dehydrogenase